MWVRHSEGRWITTADPTPLAIGDELRALLALLLARWRDGRAAVKRDAFYFERSALTLAEMVCITAVSARVVVSPIS